MPIGINQRTHGGHKERPFWFGDKQFKRNNRYKMMAPHLLLLHIFKALEVFSVTIPELLLELNCDDGAVVYLNDYRIVDQNMPSAY